MILHTLFHSTHAADCQRDLLVVWFLRPCVASTMGLDLGMCGRTKHADVALEDCMETVWDQLLTPECATSGGAAWLPPTRHPENELTCAG